MRPGRHFDPDATQCPSAGKTTARLLFTIDATHGWPIEHMGIKNTNVHEPSRYAKPLYVRAIPGSDGTFTHGSTVGRLRRILRDGNSAGFYYIDARFSYLAEHG